MKESILLGKELFILKTESRGNLHSFELTVGDMIKISELLGKAPEKTSPEEFVRVLLSVTCHPKDRIINESSRPVGYSLSLDDVSKINPDELEKFATLFLENNERLYRKRISKSEPAKNGKGTVVSFEYGEMEHPREDKESSVSCLHRLWILDEAKRYKHNKDITQSLFGKYNDLSNIMKGFSHPLEDQMVKTLKMGDALKSSLKFAESQAKQKMSFFEQPTPGFNDFADLSRKIEENRIRPFEKLGDKLDKLIEVSSDTAEFVVQMNKTQTSLADELKKAGDFTLFYSKQNIKLTLFMISLTCISIILSAYSIYYSSSSSKQQLKYVNDTTSQMSKQLKSIDDHTISSSSINQNQTQKLIQLQTVTVAELKKMRQKEQSRKL